MEVATLITAGQILVTVVGTASAIAAALAPLTKTDIDNKIWRWTRKAYQLLRKLGLNDLAPRK